MHQDAPHRPGPVGAAAEPSPGTSDVTATPVPHDDGDESHLIRGYD
ncbi:hypothetical protein FHX42_001978 [Saccharopolyspora lacisalsi]|uniref:Uncharacterized protein n=1 Tax=Halosaccharopolyspora lacisalsi TaxID=1000566 RepID=A0A839DZI3_9PSEU|nr:hypothetical protein [Halosaccharopolyspora lacisalsi]